LVVRFTTAGLAAFAISDQAGIVAVGDAVWAARSVQNFPDTAEDPRLGRTSSPVRATGIAHRPNERIQRMEDPPVRGERISSDRGV
jgi:hypothetical protein